MRTYTLILKGIDKVDFPSHMSRSAVLLIKKLCRDVPTERLGYQRGGIDDIKKHKCVIHIRLCRFIMWTDIWFNDIRLVDRWFQSFDRDGLSEQTLMPPLIQMVSSPVDTRNFDYFPFDDDIPPDELSGWDEVYRYIIKYCEYYLEVKHSRTISLQEFWVLWVTLDGARCSKGRCYTRFSYCILYLTISWASKHVLYTFMHGINEITRLSGCDNYLHWWICEFVSLEMYVRHSKSRWLRMSRLCQLCHSTHSMFMRC